MQGDWLWGSCGCAGESPVARTRAGCRESHCGWESAGSPWTPVYALPSLPSPAPSSPAEI